MEFQIPNVGTLSINRAGECGGGHYKWRARVELTDGTVLRTWGTVPKHWEAPEIFAWACDAIADVESQRTGDDTGNEWNLLAHDAEEDPDEAVRYAVSTLWWRARPHTLDQSGNTYRYIQDVEDAWRHGYINYYPDEGDVLDLYRNNDDEPTKRLVMGPRGGVTRENF